MTVAILVLLGVCLIGGAIAFVAIRNRSRKPAAPAWRTTPGTIVASAVAQQRDAGGGMSHTYVPQVQYAYLVDGVERKGHRLTYAPTRSTRLKEAQAWCDRYPVGMAVTVHYDPAKPQDCVLDRDDTPAAAPASVVEPAPTPSPEKA